MVRLLPPGQVVFFQEGRDPLDIVGVSPQLGFYLGAKRITNTGLRHLLLNALLQNLRQCFVPRRQAGVLPQANHRRRTPLRGRLLIEQNSQPSENIAARIEERHFVGAFKILLPEPKLDVTDHDLEILGDLFRLGFGQRALELAEHSLGLLPLLVLIRQARLRRQRVKLAEALVRTDLGTVLHFDRQQPVGVVVAEGDPAGNGGRLGGRSWQCEHGSNQKQGNFSNQDFLLSTQAPAVSARFAQPGSPSVLDLAFPFPSEELPDSQPHLHRVQPRVRRRQAGV